MPHRVTHFLRTTSALPSPRKRQSAAGGDGHDAPANASGSGGANANGSGSSSISDPSASSAASSRNNYIAASPYSSDSEDHRQQLQQKHPNHHHHHHALKMPDHFAEALARHARLSRAFRRRSTREPASAAAASSAPPGVTLDWRIESPPVVFYKAPGESTGALVSGQVLVDVRDDAGVEVDALTATLSLHFTHRRPFHAHCPSCQHRVTQLRSWRLMAAHGSAAAAAASALVSAAPGGSTTPVTLRRGRHQFPFSTLLEGHLPASTDMPLLSIAYDFRAEAVVARPGPGRPRATLRFDRSLHVKRSVAGSLYPHNSVRVFPPTNIKASAHYDSVIHPTGLNRLTLKLDGLLWRGDRPDMVDFWRLKKVTWRLEETVKTYAPACNKHLPAALDGKDDKRKKKKDKKANGVGGGGTHGTNDDHSNNNNSHSSSSNNRNNNHDGDGDEADDEADDVSRGELRTQTRLLGEKQLHEGWKPDYTGADGTVDLELDYGINAHHARTRHAHLSPARGPRYACDVRTDDGTEVTHSLALELVVSREYAPEGMPHLAAHTGTGRILRMHFAVVLTEWPGLGVSWDNEAPPVYQDVPPSPPAYPPPPGPDAPEAAGASAGRAGGGGGGRLSLCERLRVRGVCARP